MGGGGALIGKENPFNRGEAFTDVPWPKEKRGPTTSHQSVQGKRMKGETQQKQGGGEEI